MTLDPELEAAFRREMVVRHRRSVQLLAWVILAFLACFLPFDLMTDRPVATAARIVSLAVLTPIAIAMTRMSDLRFERWVGVLASTWVLVSAGYFAVVMRELRPVPEAFGTTKAGMVLLTVGVSLGLAPLLGLRALVALTAATASVAIGSVVAVGSTQPASVAAYAVTILLASTMGLMMASALQESRRREFVQARELARERARSESLLHNVLPAEIAERLKDAPGAIAERFDDATVLFADLVGFTQLSERMSPEELVAMLDAVFSEFDEIAGRHGLEKIKTIGDAYMVVGGVPAPHADHVTAVARMALEMRDAGARRSTDARPLRVRIGIHTGPVVAGVIGKREFIYDLWGDTVNTASRMESHGVEGGIQLTAAVRARLNGDFRVEPRGSITGKGKGEMEAYLLVDRRGTWTP